MKTFGLIGHPLSHSFSQRYFTEKFQKEDLADCIFNNYDLPEIEHLIPLIEGDHSLLGLSVTIPHKQSILPLLHNKDEAVTKIGACNSVRIYNGKLTGFNTDVIGFEISLSQKLKPQHNKALILGTGGSAKAVSYALSKLNIQHMFVSRKTNNNSASIKYTDITKETLLEYPLIINCTPIGMFPNINESPEIPYEHLSAKNYLFDLTYNPSQTLFIQQGIKYGAVTQNGYDMLIFQAEASWKLWNDR